MKIYTLSLLMAVTAFLACNARAGVEMVSNSQPQPKAAVVTTTVSSDSGICTCSTPVAPIHFKDGLTPNGPVTSEAVYGDPEGDSCGCAQSFGFRDYGPAHVVVPPLPVDTKEMKHPSS